MQQRRGPIERLRQRRGRHADSPDEIPPLGWKDILLRVKDEIGEDRVGLIAAGCAFYLLLALFPALTALVSIYGLVADPADVANQIQSLSAILPSGGISIIQEQLTRLIEQRPESLGFGVVGGLAVSLWSANNGIKTLFEAMNIAFEEAEKRGFIKVTLIGLAFTVGALLLLILFIFAFAVIPAVLKAVGLGAFTEALISFVRWPLLLLVAAVGISLLYRYGPSRRPAKWRWITIGSVLAAFAWIAASLALGFYLANFGNYDATYGSLGAAIGFMTWLLLSMFIVIAGAELDAEIEHQTARDSTVGAPKPMGQRGARMADTIGKPKAGVARGQAADEPNNAAVGDRTVDEPAPYSDEYGALAVGQALGRFVVRRPFAAIAAGAVAGVFLLRQSAARR